MSNSSFAADTKKIWNGILLVVLAGIVAAILYPIVFAGSIVGVVASLTGTKVGFWAGLGTAGILWIVFEIAVIVGYVFVFLGLNGFEKKVEGKDKKSVGFLKIAYILAAVSVLLSIFHLPVIPWLCEVAAFVLTTLGYYQLKSGGFNEPVKKAFNLLFISQIIYLVAAVVGLIPFTGVLTAIAEIVAFVLLLAGWYKVKSNS